MVSMTRESCNERSTDKNNRMPEPLPENGRIYIAIVVGGAAILLMILAEMKFFRT
jgi:hypothetical protein